MGNSKKCGENEIEKQFVPGPGMYSQDKKESSSKYSFGKDSRGKNVTSDTPGPGQYYIPCSIVEVPSYLKAGGSFDPRYKVV